MSENPREAAQRILMEAMSPQPEEAKPETAPIEIEESTPSETLETPEETPPPVEEQEDISTLNHLAETLDIPIEDMYALSLKMPEGTDPTDLGTLKNFYLDNKDLDHARQEIENERSLLAADKDKLKEMPPVHAELVQALANKTSVEQEWQALEQSGLRQANPGEYSAKAVEIQNRYQAAMNQLGTVNQEVEVKHQERLATNQKELHKLVPDLIDETKREGIAKRVSGMFQHYGVDTSYLGAIEDPRAMQMLIEISNLFEQKGNARSKRVDTAPKVLKPQSVRESTAGRQASLKRLTEKARKSGERSDQVAAVSALIRS